MEKSNSVINGCRGNNVRDCNSTGSSYGGGGDCGFSWPPRSYTCTFCQREFRSAQALGGHMNVHRRDRARLRRSSPPPILDLNLNFSPNPNFSRSPSSSPPPPPTRLLLPPLASTLTSLVSSPLSSLSSPSSAASPTDHRQMTKRWPGALVSAKMQTTPSSFGTATRADGDCIHLKKAAEFVRLDLEIGLPSSNPEEDLDLELRLGYYS